MNLMKYNTLTVQVLTGVLSLFIISSFSAQDIFADGTSLSIAPSVMQISTQTPADITTPFTLSNQSEQSINLHFGYKAWDTQASSNGTVVFLSQNQMMLGPDKKIFEKMQVLSDTNTSLTSVNIGPKQTKNLQLHIKLPENEPEGDYYFTLVFLQSPKKENQITLDTSVEDQKSFSSIQAGIGMNVLLRVGNEGSPQGSIESFSTPFFRDSGPTPFTLTVHNEGSHFIIPQGTIIIKNILGQVVGKITIPSTTVLAGTSRMISSTPTESNANTSISLWNKSIQNNTSVIWPEKYILGLYTATLTIALSTHGPLFTRTIHFFAFPIGFSVSVLLIILLIGIIIIRLKKKISER